MSSREVEVCVDQSDGSSILVGRLFLTRRRGASESATFTYARGWLERGGAYAIDPQLPLSSGPFHTDPEQRMFRALSDSAPDRWGVELARRYEVRRARKLGERPRSFGESGLLLQVRDELRQGELRLRDPDTGAFLAPDGGGVPQLVDLTRLLSASAGLDRDSASDEDLRLLLEAGSSLGGARPKANVEDKGCLQIAKFPRPEADSWNVIVWEQVALVLAAASGIRVPTSRLELVSGRQVLLVTRFDRSGGRRDGRRIGYVSALTMLEASDHERRSYLELAEVIEERSPQATEDLRELWRRIAFSILISNTDDHLRNHGFLRVGAGWVVSPAFDLNPAPDGAGLLSTAIQDPRDRSASIAALVEVADYFRVPDAGAELRPILDATGGWRNLAARLGVGHEVARLEPAFEHAERTAARRITGG